jgi:hypothetical protein
VATDLNYVLDLVSSSDAGNYLLRRSHGIKTYLQSNVKQSISGLLEAFGTIHPL